MREFSVSTDGKILSIVSVATQYAVERPFTELSTEIVQELRTKLGIVQGTPKWINSYVSLASDSPLYLWYLFEKGQDKYEAQEEPAVVESGMTPFDILYGNVGLDSPAGTLDIFSKLTG